MSQHNMSSILPAWDAICSALGFSIGINEKLDSVTTEPVRLHLKALSPEFPELSISLAPVHLCVNGQLSLFLLGPSLGLLVSCDMTTKVVSVSIFDALAQRIHPNNIKSLFPTNLSLYQIYDKLKATKAMYLRGTVWSPLSLS